MRLQHKVSTSLKQALERLKLTENVAEKKGESRTLSSPSFSPPYLFHVAVVFLSSLSQTTIHYHRLLVTVDRKVMLTGEVNGWPLGIPAV